MRRVLKASVLVALLGAIGVLGLIAQQDGRVRATGEPVPDFPLFQVTIDETEPANPNVPPFDDDCPVGVPCKIRTAVVVGPAQPLIPWASVTPPTFFVANGGDVPDGAPVGKASFETHFTLPSLGPCDTSGARLRGEALLRDATIDFSTATGSMDDLASDTNWPGQLNDEHAATESDFPGAQLWARYVGVFHIEFDPGILPPDTTVEVPVNILVLRIPDGSYLSVVFIGDPSAMASPDGASQLLPDSDIGMCSPFTGQLTVMGVTGVPGVEPQPLRTCEAVGPHPFTGIFLPMPPNPASDPIVRTDLVSCSGPAPELPLFRVTIDEMDPADPTIPPADDNCPVDVPCKIRTDVVINPHEPAFPLGHVTPGAFIVAPGAEVPDGFRVGIATFEIMIGLAEFDDCSNNGFLFAGETPLHDATTDLDSGTGDAGDLVAPDRWPGQLNDEKATVESHYPGAQLWARYVGVFHIVPDPLAGAPLPAIELPLNILTFILSDGNFLSINLIGDPSVLLASDGTMSLAAPDIKACSPLHAQTTIQGVAVADPAPDVLPPPPMPVLRVCREQGVHTFLGIFLNLFNDTVDDLTLRADTATCGVFEPPPPPDPNDFDGDGVPNDADNCPGTPNPGQADNDADGAGDVCDPDNDNDTFPNFIEHQLGSNPFNPTSTPEHIMLAETCSDDVDNDGDGAADEADPGCQPFADFDGDGFPNEAEETLGSDPNNPDSTPEHFLFAPTCFDDLDNDGDGLTDTDDPGCHFFLDSDGDGFLNRIEIAAGSDPENPASTPEIAPLDGVCADGLDNDGDGLVDGEDPGCGLTADDGDGDGFADPVEQHLGSDPANPESAPEHILLPETCSDGIDNDGDGLPDFQDPGCLILDLDGDGDLSHEDDDDDNDAFTDAQESFVGTDPNDGCPDNEDDDSWPADMTTIEQYGKHDGTSDIFDIVLLTPPVFGQCTGDPEYTLRKDFSGIAYAPDGCIDIFDIVMLTPPVFGKSCTP